MSLRAAQKICSNKNSGKYTHILNHTLRQESLEERAGKTLKNVARNCTKMERRENTEGPRK